MNVLQLAYISKPEPDRRYRILVSLQRSDRPRYWHFLCPNCGAKVCELMNQEIYTMTDFYDAQNLQNHAVGIRCKGANKGEYCRYWYYFNIN